MEGLIATKINNEGIKTNNYNTHLDPSDQRAASKRTEFWIMLNLQRLLKELPVKKSSIWKHLERKAILNKTRATESLSKRISRRVVKNRNPRSLAPWTNSIVNWRTTTWREAIKKSVSICKNWLFLVTKRLDNELESYMAKASEVQTSAPAQAAQWTPVYLTSSNNCLFWFHRRAICIHLWWISSLDSLFINF